MPGSIAILLACAILILGSLALASDAAAGAMTAGETAGSGPIQVALLGISFIAFAVLVTTLRPVRENRRR